MLFKLTGRTFDRLDEMLEDAINGRFDEGKYDESRLSRLEVKWKRFLTASALSEQGIREEQDGIKSLISDISHQTRTPLSNILLYTELLKEKEKDPQLLSLVERIEEQSQKLDFLMRSLVKISRLENGVFTLHPVKQALKPMLEAVREQAEETAQTRGIRIDLEAGEEQACFDRKWTEEAVFNLVENAVKYSPSGSGVWLSVRSFEIFTAVDVKDQGIGIREEEQAQIFGRFYRSPEVSGEPGIGVGLYLAGKLASYQGGYLDVRSTHGQGSTFSLFIPNEPRKNE